jgi:Response regulators consisting of a CheY-like receiver domain and a winged-helix DNA-binding domain
MSLIKYYLKKHGYEAEYIYKAEGIEVIKKVKEYVPDLIILENSVGSEGQLCNSIKSSINSKVPVILMAANVSIDQQQENCDADDVIPKPFDPRLLLMKIEKLLGRM